MTPLWQRNVVLLWLIQFTALAAVSLSHPFIPLFVERDLGVADESQVKLIAGLLQAVFFLCAAIMAPLWGTWADHHGRRVMVIRALLGAGVGVGLMAVVRTVPQLFFVRALQGVTGGLIAAAAALVASMAPRDRMATSLGWLQNSVTSAHFVGPLLGGLVVDRLGYRNTFAIGSAVCFVCAAAVALFIREHFIPVPADERASFADNLTLWRESDVLRYAALAVALSQLAIMVVNPIMPLFVQHLLGRNHGSLNSAVGLMSGLPALTGFLFAPLWGITADRRGHARTLGWALLGSGLVYAPQAVAGSLAVFGLLRAGVGGFNAGIAPAAQALASRAVDRKRTAASLSLMTSARMFGGFLGPLLGGVIASQLGWPHVFLVTAGLQLAAAGLVFRRLTGLRTEPSVEEVVPTVLLDEE